MIAALGGAAKVKGLAALRARGTIVASTPDGDQAMAFERTQVLPSRMHVVVQTGAMTQVLAPDVGFTSMGGQTQKLPASARDEPLAAIGTDPLAVALRADDPEVVASAAGTERVGDVEGQVMQLQVDGRLVSWVVDSQRDT